MNKFLLAATAIALCVFTAPSFAGQPVLDAKGKVVGSATGGGITIIKIGKKYYETDAVHPNGFNNSRPISKVYGAYNCNGEAYFRYDPYNDQLVKAVNVAGIVTNQNLLYNKVSIEYPSEAAPIPGFMVLSSTYELNGQTYCQNAHAVANVVKMATTTLQFTAPFTVK
jgi:hypothetical protein